MKNDTQQERAWYTRREGIVRGPFTPGHITRYILLGRIRLEDELSRDRATWRQARSLTALLPAEMVNLQGWQDYRRLDEARMRVDERKQERRCAQCPNCANCHPERRSSPDQRKGEDSLPVDRYPHASNPRQVHSHRLRTLLLLVLAGLVFAWMVPGAN